MNITCLDCLQTFRTERLKWYNARCPCGAKVRYAFAAHGDVTIAGIFRALMRYHFGDDAGPQ